MEKELRYLGEALKKPKRPFVAILGGAKISGKIDVIKNLLSKVDRILIGGGMAYTFMKAQGLEIGDSLLDEGGIEIAKMIMTKAKEKGVELLLPVDTVVADAFSNPISYFIPGSFTWLEIVGGIVNFVDERAGLIEPMDELRRTSLDFYAAVRSLYRQNRESEISNGRVTKPPLPGEDE